MVWRSCCPRDESYSLWWSLNFSSGQNFNLSNTLAPNTCKTDDIPVSLTCTLSLMFIRKSIVFLIHSTFDTALSFCSKTHSHNLFCLSVYFTLSQFTSPLPLSLSCSLFFQFSPFLPISSSLPVLQLFHSVYLSFTNTDPCRFLSSSPHVDQRRRRGITTFPISIKLYHYEVLWIMWVFKTSKKCGSAPAALSWNLHPRPQSVGDQRDQVWERNRRILFKVRKHNMCIQSTCAQIETGRKTEVTARENKRQKRPDMRLQTGKRVELLSPCCFNKWNLIPFFELKEKRSAGITGQTLNSTNTFTMMKRLINFVINFCWKQQNSLQRVDWMMPVPNSVQCFSPSWQLTWLLTED